MCLKRRHSITLVAAGSSSDSNNSLSQLPLWLAAISFGFIAPLSLFFSSTTLPLPGWRWRRHCCQALRQCLCYPLRHDAYSINFEYAQNGANLAEEEEICGGRWRCWRESGDVCGSERKIAKIVCRLIKRKQNLPINEMWQLSVNFIGARLAGDGDAGAGGGAGWRHLATHPTPVRSRSWYWSWSWCWSLFAMFGRWLMRYAFASIARHWRWRLDGWLESCQLLLSSSLSPSSVVVCFVCPISHTVAAAAASVRKSYISWFHALFTLAANYAHWKAKKDLVAKLSRERERQTESDASSYPLQYFFSSNLFRSFA